MKVIVVGCGRLGSELAYRLYKQGHDVSVVDTTVAAFSDLPHDFRGKLCEGDALNYDVLHRAGIENADALAVVTNSDALNIAVAHMARKVFKVPNVVARNYSPRCRGIFELFDIQVVSSTSWGAQRLEELIYHADMKTVFSAGNGEIEIYELVVPDVWAGKELGEIFDCVGCVVVSLTHAGRSLLPRPDMKVEACDVLHVSATSEGIESMRSKIHLKKLGEV